MPKRPCARPGCQKLVERGYCDGCAPKHSAKARVELGRPSAAKRGYGRQWQKERLAFFNLHPVCVDPYRLHGPMAEPATVMDHIRPHKGDAELFRDPKNRQAMCKSCHDRKTATEDSTFAAGTRG